jgi:hypothetical protein
MSKPSILQVFHNSPGITGPFVLPAQGAGKTSLLVRYTDDMDGTSHVYRTVTYVVGPSGATSVTLTAATKWCVLIDLPDGPGTDLTTLSALFPSPAGITPDTDPPPPAPGTIKGGNAM